MPLKIVPDVIGGQEIAELDPTASVRDAARLMAGRRIGSVLITDGGTLRGIFTERDVSFGVDAPSLDPDATELAGVMTVDPDTIVPDVAYQVENGFATRLALKYFGSPVTSSPAQSGGVISWLSSSSSTSATMSP